MIEEGFQTLSKIQEEISLTVSLPFDNIISEFQQEADSCPTHKQYRLRLTTLRLLSEYGSYIHNSDLSKFADWCTILKQSDPKQQTQVDMQVLTFLSGTSAYFSPEHLKNQIFPILQKYSDSKSETVRELFAWEIIKLMGALSKLKSKPKFFEKQAKQLISTFKAYLLDSSK